MDSSQIEIAGSPNNSSGLNPPRYGEEGLIACHECDQLHQLPRLEGKAKANCQRCGATLVTQTPGGADHAISLHFSTLLLIIIVNSFPFLSLDISGRTEQTHLLSSAWAMIKVGHWELGMLVALTSVIFPLICTLGWIYLLLSTRLGIQVPGFSFIYRLTIQLTPWSLIGVFMLGVLVAIVKLLDLADVILGTALYAYIALLFVSAATRLEQNKSLLWPSLGLIHKPDKEHPSANKHDLQVCHHCGLLAPLSLSECPRCQSHLHARKPKSIERTWALIFSAAILFIPANVYPVMTVIRFGSGEPSTILGGIIYLIDANMIPLALLVLFASIIVPLLKLVVLSYLLISIRRGSNWRPRDRTRLFRITESVGAWSMVDIYLVAILTALVNMDALATIRPGIGATFFAAVVVLTMLAAHSFDPRLIWDNRKA